jgi:membrane associated rhomboid family serine protease
LIPVGIDQGQRRIPWVALALATSNIVIYVITANLADFEAVKMRYGFIPDAGCLATLVSHMFLHDNALHLISNLIFFMVPAMKLEDAIGSLRFAGLYLMCGIAANACHVLMGGNSFLPLIGASGAIAGIVGAFMVLYPGSKLVFWIIPPLPVFVRLWSWVFLGYWFVNEIFKGCLLKTSEQDSLVAVWAHVGGFAFGALSMAAFYGWGRGRRLEWR